MGIFFIAFFVIFPALVLTPIISVILSNKLVNNSLIIQKGKDLGAVFSTIIVLIIFLVFYLIFTFALRLNMFWAWDGFMETTFLLFSLFGNILSRS